MVIAAVLRLFCEPGWLVLAVSKIAGQWDSEIVRV